MKNILLTLVAFLATTTMLAQRTISGKIVEKDSREPAVQATVALLTPDSTMVGNTLTGNDGQFSITAKQDGRYLLKVSYVGFTDLYRYITVKDNKPVALGTVTIAPDAVLLKETTVTGHVAKVTLKEDTFIYNAAAYRTPEGSVIEELVKKLPGAQVSDDGTITINGKQVKKIKVDGKEFMTGDTQTALKNLPTSIVDKVKAYDEKSDLARISGIDDGDESTVLDFGIKPGMNRGTFTNNDIAYGTDKRYAARLMGAKFTSSFRLMAMANANNVNDQGMAGGGGMGRFGGGRQGLSASKMAGVNMNYEKRNVIKLDGSIRWNHRDGDAWSKTSSENFVNTRGSFSNSQNQNYSRSNSWNAQMRLEWTPDTMTNIMFRPTFSYGSNDGLSHSESGTFNEDPYKYVTDPLSADALLQLSAIDSILVNFRENSGLSYSDNTRVGGMLQLNRKLNSKGRNVTVQLNGNISDTGSKSLSTNYVHLFQIKSRLDPLSDSIYTTNRFNLTPQKSYSYNVRATYSEPIAKATFLQMSYRFEFTHTKSDRKTYDFSKRTDGSIWDMSDVAADFRQWDNYLIQLYPNTYMDYEDALLSRYSEYKNYNHSIELMLRIIRQKYNFNVGVNFMPQKSHYTQNYRGIAVDTVRSVFNFTPTADFRYKFSRQHQLRFTYRGSSSPPSITDLLDITDDSNPLNITKGNPGLKPSFTSRLNLRYNNYIQSHQRFIAANVNFNTTQNSISRMVTYNDSTGGRVTQPMNINGNWNIGGNFIFNTAIDSSGYFNVNTTTDISYNNNVGYLQVDRTSDSQKNTVRQFVLGERLAASYRNDWIEFEVTGAFTFNHARNALQPTANLDTWQYSYGFNTNIQLPWKMTLFTSMAMNSRRGYNDESMNTNELIWNAQISQSFLKGSPLTLSLQFYDILKRQSNISRSISAMSRSDTEYNAINSYAMLHVIYRMNLFGSKEARQNMRRFGDGFGEGFGGGRGGGRGGRGGGFGGGRGGGGFGGPR